MRWRQYREPRVIQYKSGKTRTIKGGWFWSNELWITSALDVVPGKPPKEEAPCAGDPTSS